MRNTFMVATIALAGCPVEEEACTDIAMASVTVEVSTADGEAPEGLVVEYAVDGGAAEPCEPFGDTFSCGWEEAGLFTITATATGYEAAEAQVEVVAGACHVEGESVDLVLEPEEMGCPQDPVPAFVATVSLADGGAVPGVEVRWSPTYTSVPPVDCEALDDVTWACAHGETGLLDLIASAPGYEPGYAEGIDVQLDPVCNVPISEQASVTLVPAR